MTIPCPLCGNPTRSWHSHHVVFRKQGGTNHPSNLLSICLGCHALLHGGHVDEAIPREFAAVYHQTLRHGLTFCTKAEKGEVSAEVKVLVGMIEEGDLTSEEADMVIRTQGLLRYCFYRAVIAGDPSALRVWHRHLANLEAWDGELRERLTLDPVDELLYRFLRGRKAVLPKLPATASIKRDAWGVVW